MRVVGGNPNASRDRNHRQRMLEAVCSHDSISLHNEEGIRCADCGILVNVIVRLNRETKSFEITLEVDDPKFEEEK